MYDLSSPRERLHVRTSSWTKETVVLTARETDVLACLLQHQSRKKIAAILDLSVRTVDTYIFHLTRKFGQHACTQLAETLQHSEKKETLLPHGADLLIAHAFKKTLSTLSHIQLIQHKNWILLFDDVNTLSDIQTFLPTDTQGWGNGQILLTTRNSHINHDKPIERIPAAHVIVVDELTPREKRILFVKLQNGSVEENDALTDFWLPCRRSL